MSETQWDATVNESFQHGGEKPTVALVNGEQYWEDYLPEVDLRPCKLQNAEWRYDGRSLWVVDSAGTTRLDGVFWRVGAIKMRPAYRSVLELIRLSGVPCVNTADSLLRGFDRLGMLHEMAAIGLPVIPQLIAIGHRALTTLKPNFPCVVKVGNYHAGYGKARATNSTEWEELRDVIFSSDDYVCIEPYIDYLRDIRCLAIGDNFWTMQRRGTTWKANAGVTEWAMIEPPAVLKEYTGKAMAHLGADVLGIDFLETAGGEFLMMECNDVPGLTGFPEATKLVLAEKLVARLRR